MPVRERIPPLQVIHIRSRSVDLAKLSGGGCESAAANQAAYLDLLDTPQRNEIAALARDWAADYPSGYRQVAAIIARLRSGEFVLDSAWTAPAECADAAAHFLFDSRRGPDYLFATSAAVLLRSLGYPARVCTGMYARRERYNRLFQQTTVLPEDVHFWTEVCLDGNTWITVEPTPGFDVLPPNRTWIERAEVVTASAIGWIRQHPIFCFALALVTILAIRFRRELANFAYTFIWLLCQLRSLRRRILATVWLIERRAALAGRARPGHATLANWYLPLARSTSHQHAALVPLLNEAARLLYAPSGLATDSITPSDRLDVICRQIALTLTLRALRRMPAPTA